MAVIMQGKCNHGLFRYLNNMNENESTDRWVEFVPDRNSRSCVVLTVGTAWHGHGRQKQIPWRNSDCPARLPRLFGRKLVVNPPPEISWIIQQNLAFTQKHELQSATHGACAYVFFSEIVKSFFARTEELQCYV